MNIVGIGRMALKAATYVGADQIIGEVCKAVIKPQGTLINKACVKIATLSFIGAMAEAGCNFIDHACDFIADKVVEFTDPDYEEGEADDGT